MTTETIDAKYEKFAKAMFLEHPPVNPRAFAVALHEYLEGGGRAETDTYLAILYTLVSMHYMSAEKPYSDDFLKDEYARLDAVFNGNPEVGNAPAS